MITLGRGATRENLLAPGDIADLRDRARRRRHLSRPRPAGRLSDLPAARARARPARLPAQPRGGADPDRSRALRPRRRRASTGWTGVWNARRRAQAGVDRRRGEALGDVARVRAERLDRSRALRGDQPVRPGRGRDGLDVGRARAARSTMAAVKQRRARRVRGRVRASVRLRRVAGAARRRRRRPAARRRRRRRRRSRRASVSRRRAPASADPRRSRAAVGARRSPPPMRARHEACPRRGVASGWPNASGRPASAKMVISMRARGQPCSRGAG